MTRDDITVMAAALLIRRCDDSIKALQALRGAAYQASELGEFDKRQVADAIERLRRCGLLGWLQEVFA